MLGDLSVAICTAAAAAAAAKKLLEDGRIAANARYSAVLSRNHRFYVVNFPNTVVVGAGAGAFEVTIDLILINFEVCEQFACSSRVDVGATCFVFVAFILAVAFPKPSLCDPRNYFRCEVDTGTC